MKACFLSVSERLPRLDKHHDVFTVNEELPDAYRISVDVTLLALQRVILGFPELDSLHFYAKV